MTEDMPEKLISGVCAAILTPRGNDGRLNESQLARNVEFLLERGVGGFAVNGATGEYCLTSTVELERMLSVVVKAAGGRAYVVCGIGAAGIEDCRARARVAEDGGARVLLLTPTAFLPVRTGRRPRVLRSGSREKRLADSAL
jgi:4-hydroxy-tetrahydrodipicolinate synthase